MAKKNRKKVFIWDYHPERKEFYKLWLYAEPDKKYRAKSKTKYKVQNV